MSSFRAHSGALRGVAGVLTPCGSAVADCQTILQALCRHAPQIFSSTPDVALGQAHHVEPAHPAPPTKIPLTDLVLVADLRLDNHGELCSTLDLPSLSTDDTVLVHAWKRWREGLVEHLVGGFALACWTPETKTLFLARDHAGERPLHYARTLGSAGGFAFASMPSGLCALPGVGRHLNIEFMAHDLALVAPCDEQTFFRGVERLAPGHLLRVTPEQVEIRRYWHPSGAKPIRYRRDADYVEDFRERFDRVVAAELAGGGGFASELSGGLDSSAVTATAAALLAPTGGRLTAFTAVPLPAFDGRALPGRFGNEGPAAAELVAMYPNIDHVLVDSAGMDLLEVSKRASQLSGRPTFNPTNQLWLDAIHDGMQARGLGILLQGLTGNATFSIGGLAALSDLLIRGRIFTLYRQVRDLRAAGYTSWRGAASCVTAPVIPRWIRRIFSQDVREFTFSYSPIHPQRAMEYGLREKAFATLFESENGFAAFQSLTYEYSDPGESNGAAAAGWGIEQRDPTQHKSIYEFCFAIPPEQFLVGAQTRSIARRAMEGRLPVATLRKNDRGQQAADWYLVMGAQRGRLAEELSRIERSPMAQHLLDLKRLRSLLENWPQSGFDRPEVNEAWHMALSRGISAGSFIADYDAKT